MLDRHQGQARQCGDPALLLTCALRVIHTVSAFVFLQSNGFIAEAGEYG